MKRSIKILVSALLLASMSWTAVPAVMPSIQASVSAASNVTMVETLENGFEWSWDESTGTVTIEGDGLLPADLSRMVAITGRSPDTLILGDNITGFSENTTPLSPGTLVLGRRFSDPSFTTVKPTESFEVSRQNGNFLAYDGGLYSVNGQTLYSYATDIPDITLRNGTRTVSDYAFYGCAAVSIVIPESVTALGDHAFNMMASTGDIPVVLPPRNSKVGYKPLGITSMGTEEYNPLFFYMQGDDLICELDGHTSLVGLAIANAWDIIGGRTPEEVYDGRTETSDLGFRTVKVLLSERDEVRDGLLFVTRRGISSGWVYQDGKVYSVRLTTNDPGLMTTDGRYSYLRSTGGNTTVSFTFADDGSVINPPSDMMVLTTDGAQVALSGLSGGGSSSSSGSGSGSAAFPGYISLIYRGGRAYIYDEQGEMLHSGWFRAEGDWFYLNDYGAAVINCWRDGEDGEPRYLKADGTMAHDEWIQDYGDWYYLGSDGRKCTGRRQIDGEWYTFDSNGVLQSSESGSSYPSSGYTVRYDENGKARIYDRQGNEMKSGWYEVDGEWYCINNYGAGVVKCWRDGKDGYPRYLKADGTMAHDEWIQDYGNWYYLTADGTKAAVPIVINGVTYYFGLAGICINPDGGSSSSS